MTKSETINDLAINKDPFLQDIIDGLSQQQKTLPCKYLYDEQGSVLFDQICRTPEYYHTRTELALLDQHLPAIADVIGTEADILEFGSGAGIKIRKLIDALQAPRSYSPIDISQEILLASSAKLKALYPDLLVFPITGDYLSSIKLPDIFIKSRHPRLIFFPGSTISNFDNFEAIRFLTHCRNLLKPGDHLLIGVDLIKPTSLLLAAYNDEQGVTAQFNLNLLERINREYSTNLDTGLFKHLARYNDSMHRIEMHLVSQAEQQVEIQGYSFEFSAGETIHTENSYKFSVEGFQHIAVGAGFSSKQCFVDSDNLFSVHLLAADEK